MILNKKGNKIDLSGYQTIIDTSLTTTEKRISGAINEVNLKVNAIKNIPSDLILENSKIYLIDENSNKLGNGAEITVESGFPFMEVESQEYDVNEVSTLSLNTNDDVITDETYWTSEKTKEFIEDKLSTFHTNILEGNVIRVVSQDDYNNMNDDDKNLAGVIYLIKNN